MVFQLLKKMRPENHQKTVYGWWGGGVASNSQATSPGEKKRKGEKKKHLVRIEQDVITTLIAMHTKHRDFRDALDKIKL